MDKMFSAQRLIARLNEKIWSQIDLRKTLILGVVLKGLPIGYGIAKMNDLVQNFVPIVAQRHIYMQHHVESYFPSIEWKNLFRDELSRRKSIIVVDDVVNTGFTKQKVESIMHSLNAPSQRFAALILNRRNLANRGLVSSQDIFAIEVDASEVECDWGMVTVPLWDLPVADGLQLCEEYFKKFWLNEKRLVTITCEGERLLSEDTPSFESCRVCA